MGHEHVGHAGSRFAFLGGHPCLDFANTVDWHASEHPSDRLKRFDDLVAWSQQAGLFSEAVGRHLRVEGERHPTQAAQTFERAIAWRELCYRVFAHTAHGLPVPGPDLQALTDARREVVSRERLVGHAGQYSWQGAEAGLDAVWWPLVRDAVALLTSPDLTRVRQCADTRGCGWLFLDTSKAGRRRWCSMEDCGNRAKALRHRQRSSRTGPD